MIDFLQTIKNSIYSPTFYTTVPSKSFKESISYFLLIILLLTTIRLIALIGPLLIDTPIQVQGFVQDLKDCFPKDLEIKITNGQTSLNTKEPYFLSCDSLGKDEKLIVIDTKTPYSSTKFDEYGAVVWITKSAVVYKENEFETKSYSLAQIKDFKLNKEVLNSYYNIFSPWLKFVGPILLLLSFIGIFLGYNFRLIYLIFFAALLWALSKIFKQALSFGQSYKVGLYAVTLGFIIDLIAGLTSRWTNFHGFPFLFTLITLGVVILNLFLPKQRQSP